MSDSLTVELPAKLIPVFNGPADVRWACGGRGSAKTRSFALMSAVYGYRYGTAGVPGIILCARQWQNSLDESSLQEVKRAIADNPVLSSYYELGDKYIKSHDGLIHYAFAGLARNISSIKSMGRLLLCWIDEAEPVSDKALEDLEPTLREQGAGWNAELWATWNPARKAAAVESRYRKSKNPMIKGTVLNWTDNPKFPEKLERQRLRDLEERPDQYQHVWEGDFVSVANGAYFASCLNKARAEHRIGKVAADGLLGYRVFIDIGGTGARADAFVMWVCQFVGREVRMLDYYEQVGQPIDYHVAWLLDRGYKPARTHIHLPHDGTTSDKVYKTSYSDAFKQAGYDVTTTPNQGAGAAKQRIEAVRRVFASCWFNEEATQPGIEALGWYHEKRDELRSVGLGPEHDWASHAADAFGLMAINVEGIHQSQKRGLRPTYAIS